MKTTIFTAIIFFSVTTVANATVHDNWALNVIDSQTEVQVVKPTNTIRKNKAKYRNNRNTKPDKSITVAGSGDLVSRAMQHVGKTASQLGLPRRLWCADFMNMLVGGSNRTAKSYLSRGSQAPYGCTNCVAVTTRKGGGHVGVVTGYDSSGNPILISGNSSNKVRVQSYSKHAVVGYRYL